MQNEKYGLKTKTNSSNYILELFNTNICGPVEVKRYCGDKYFILFVDDYCKMMAMMFLKEKYDIFQLFKWY